MSRTEERSIVEQSRRRTVMGPNEKSNLIQQYTELLRRASRVEPSVGAKMLAEIWAAKQSLDWGCTPMVTVQP